VCKAGTLQCADIRGICLSHLGRATHCENMIEGQTEKPLCFLYCHVLCNIKCIFLLVYFWLFLETTLVLGQPITTLVFDHNATDPILQNSCNLLHRFYCAL
jgi:hypothetical protein